MKLVTGKLVLLLLPIVRSPGRVIRWAIKGPDIIITLFYFDTIKSGTAVPFTGVYIHVNLRILIKIMVTVIMIII